MNPKCIHHVPIAIVPVVGVGRCFYIEVERRFVALDILTILIALIGGHFISVFKGELPAQAAERRQNSLLAFLAQSNHNERVRGIARGTRRKKTKATRVALAGVRELAPMDHGNVEGGRGGAVVGKTVGADLHGHRHVCVVEPHPSLEAETALPFFGKGKVDPVDVAIRQDYCGGTLGSSLGLLQTNFRRQRDAQRHVGSYKLGVRLLDHDFDVKTLSSLDQKKVLLVSLGHGGD